MAFFVSNAQTDETYPNSGWYYIKENKDGDEFIYGPFFTKYEALDHMSGGSYVDYQLEDSKEYLD